MVFPSTPEVAMMKSLLRTMPPTVAFDHVGLERRSRPTVDHDGERHVCVGSMFSIVLYLTRPFVYLGKTLSR
jgi:hypothetical protein